MCFNTHLRTYRNKPISELLSTGSSEDNKSETMSSNIFLLVWKRLFSPYKRNLKNLVDTHGQNWKADNNIFTKRIHTWKAEPNLIHLKDSI